MASPANDRRSEYVCVDKDAEVGVGGDPQRNTKAARMAPVECLFYPVQRFFSCENRIAWTAQV